jgi:hypothetical protein
MYNLFSIGFAGGHPEAWRPAKPLFKVKVPVSSLKKPNRVRQLQ